MGVLMSGLAGSQHQNLISISDVLDLKSEHKVFCCLFFLVIIKFNLLEKKCESILDLMMDLNSMTVGASVWSITTKDIHQPFSYCKQTLISTREFQKYLVLLYLNQFIKP